ncbi:hypothetical protein Bca4012_075892 [Brassica carinata]|uniref:Uncharacterized protein n=1 Tax=Brassica carinata TaxID=52824 RepID=A0A8X7QFT9_BRACI|nr:hypothetical protein Bca52824_073713 [Brassica carinata]
MAPTQLYGTLPQYQGSTSRLWDVTIQDCECLEDGNGGKYVTTRKIGRVEHEETIVNRDSRYNDRVERSEATSTKHTQRWNELVLVVRAARWSSGQWGSACATPFPCFQESFLSLVTFHNEERPKWQSGSDHGG